MRGLPEIHGSSVDEVHRELEFRFAAVRQIASGLVHEALSWWGKHTNHWWEKAPPSPLPEKIKPAERSKAGEQGIEFPAKGILTYAPAATDFAQAAELWLPIGDQPALIRDRSGRILPAQTLPRKPIGLNGLGQPRNDSFPPDIYRRILFMDTFKAMSIESHAQVFPFREWLAVEDGGSGLCVAVKGLYDYEGKLNPLTGCPEIALTLLRGIGLMGRINTMQRRGGASPAVATPEAQCLGPHTVEWSYIPYTSNGEDKAPFISIAQSFLYPPVSHAVRSREKDTAAVKAQGVSWKAGNLQFSAFKRSIDGKDWILRFFENQGKPVEFEVSVPGFCKAWLSNLAEEPGEELGIRSGKIKLTAGAYKAVTVRLGREEK
jgi:hypothetical protein